MADRLTTDIPRLAKLSTSSGIDWAKIEGYADTSADLPGRGEGVVTLDEIRTATRWIVTVEATSKGKGSTHTFDDENAAAAFVEGFGACAKLRRRGPRKATAK